MLSNSKHWIINRKLIDQKIKDWYINTRNKLNKEQNGSYDNVYQKYKTRKVNRDRLCSAEPVDNKAKLHIKLNEISYSSSNALSRRDNSERDPSIRLEENNNEK